jgi:hypothetical protein
MTQFVGPNGQEVQKVPEFYPLSKRGSAKVISSLVHDILKAGGAQICEIRLDGPHQFVRVIRTVPAAAPVHKDFSVFAQIGNAEIEEFPTHGSPLLRVAQMFRALESDSYRVSYVIAGSLEPISEFFDVANSPTMFGAVVVVDDSIDEDDVILCGTRLADTEWRIRKVLRSSFGREETDE